MRIYTLRFSYIALSKQLNCCQPAFNAMLILFTIARQFALPIAITGQPFFMPDNAKKTIPSTIAVLNSWCV